LIYLCQTINSKSSCSLYILLITVNLYFYIFSTFGIKTIYLCVTTNSKSL
jgi:hypothetical protein